MNGLIIACFTPAATSWEAAGEIPLKICSAQVMVKIQRKYTQCIYIDWYFHQWIKSIIKQFAREFFFSRSFWQAAVLFISFSLFLLVTSRQLPYNGNSVALTCKYAGPPPQKFYAGLMCSSSLPLWCSMGKPSRETTSSHCNIMKMQNIPSELNECLYTPDVYEVNLY